MPRPKNPGRQFYGWKSRNLFNKLREEHEHLIWFQVFNEFYKDIRDELNGKFLIDSTLGREGKFQMDFISNNIQQEPILQKTCFFAADSPINWDYSFL